MLFTPNSNWPPLATNTTATSKQKLSLHSIWMNYPIIHLHLNSWVVGSSWEVSPVSPAQSRFLVRLVVRPLPKKHPWKPFHPFMVQYNCDFLPTGGWYLCWYSWWKYNWNIDILLYTDTHTHKSHKSIKSHHESRYTIYGWSGLGKATIQKFHS